MFHATYSEKFSIILMVVPITQFSTPKQKQRGKQKSKVEALKRHHFLTIYTKRAVMDFTHHDQSVWYAILNPLWMQLN
jgi:hypothetical protein